MGIRTMPTHACISRSAETAELAANRGPYGLLTSASGSLRAVIPFVNERLMLLLGSLKAAGL